VKVFIVTLDEARKALGRFADALAFDQLVSSHDLRSGSYAAAAVS
jgi:hypothetical protein